MTRSETKLLLQLFNYAMDSDVTVDAALGYLSAVKVAFQYNKEKKYHQFAKVLRDFSAKKISIRRVKVKLKTLFKGHKYLIMEFNSLMPMKHRITLSLDNGQLGELPWDVLDIICKRLDFDDLFSFSGVCNNWRTFHQSNFLSSQEPLLLRMTSSSCGTHSYSFISIPNRKVYDLKMMSCIRFKRPNSIYVRVSSGYFILAHENNSFMLFNPFTRKELVIDASFTVNHVTLYQHEALLAFEKCSQEFVLVVLCKDSSRLYVYQSRYSGWLTCSSLKSEVVVDFVVLNNIIYVVTNNANIGVLNLNSGNIQFLNLKNTPEKLPYRDLSSMTFKLVNCDEQLLLIDLRSWYSREVYKIDLSTMNYVRLKSLGDIALFYVFGKNCRALSNPQRFGYRSNYVYEVNTLSKCGMYDWNDYSLSYYNRSDDGDFNFNWCFRHLIGQGSAVRDFNLFDWCFRHLKYEVDYSLVE